MSQTYKLGIIGTPGSVLLYQALGVETFGVSSNDEAREIVADLCLGKIGEDNAAEYAVVFVEESFYNEFPQDLVERFAKRALPAVVPVPSADGSGDSTNRLKNLVEKAVGSDILG